MKPAAINAFFERLAAAQPAPVTELHYVNTYTLLVAVVLSAQMTDKGVNKATLSLFSKIQTPEAMLELGEEKLRDYVKSVNLFKTKAKNILQLSRDLIAHFQGEVPRTREQLLSLPGVGRKTANVVLNVAFGEAVMPVDAHVFRVANRTGLAPGPTPAAVEAKLMNVLPKAWAVHAHHWLILHGRYVCKARKPLCGACVVRDLCGYAAKDG